MHSLSHADLARALADDRIERARLAKARPRRRLRHRPPPLRVRAA